jgi:methyl-accepting chemotaxis protein
MKRKFSIKQKMVLMICGILLLSMTLLGIISSTLSEAMLKKSIFSELNNINEGIIGTLSLYYKSCLNILSNNINIANSFIDGKVQVDEKKTININAVNQITGDKKNISLPVMLIDNQPVTEDFKLIDKMTDMLGSAVTIFQIIPKGMIRIATSIVQTDGSRAIGTYIPADSPVYQSIIKGESYRGRAFVVNAWYMTEYKPIYDVKTKKIIGAIFCGLKPNLTTFRDEILKIKIGDTGYSYIIDTEGTLMIHPKMEGENIYESKDDKGNYFIKEICNKKSGIIY